MTFNFFEPYDHIIWSFKKLVCACQKNVCVNGIKGLLCSHAFLLLSTTLGFQILPVMLICSLISWFIFWTQLIQHFPPENAMPMPCIFFSKFWVRTSFIFFLTEPNIGMSFHMGWCFFFLLILGFCVHIIPPLSSLSRTFAFNQCLLNANVFENCILSQIYLPNGQPKNVVWFWKLNLLSEHICADYWTFNVEYCVEFTSTFTLHDKSNQEGFFLWNTLTCRLANHPESFQGSCSLSSLQLMGLPSQRCRYLPTKIKGT